jgi:hypothetical protein
MALDLANDELNGAVAKPKIDFKLEVARNAAVKSGGAYIPPHRLKAMMLDAEEHDKEGAGEWYGLQQETGVNVCVRRVPTTELGGVEEEYQWSDQQGQHLQHQAAGARGA